MLRVRRRVGVVSVFVGCGRPVAARAVVTVFCGVVWVVDFCFVFCAVGVVRVWCRYVCGATTVVSVVDGWELLSCWGAGEVAVVDDCCHGC